MCEAFNQQLYADEDEKNGYRQYNGIYVHNVFCLFAPKFNKQMLLKVLKAVWFLSVLALFATLLFSYASWREELVVQEEAGSQLIMGREVLFYVMLGVFLTINVLVYLVRNMFLKQED